MKTLLTAGMLLLIMQACFKEDERVLPYPGITSTIPDSVQAYESFFDFESGEVISSFPINEWQLGFECGKNGWRIITNSGAGWFIYNTRQRIIPSGMEMPVNLAALYDVMHLWPDSTAVGHWVNTDNEPGAYTNFVYMMGKYTNGRFADRKEIQFLELTDTSYTFYYHDEHVSDTVIIKKNDEFNFTYYSFDKQNQIQPEPEKSTFDLMFTSYYDLATLFGQTIPYRVGGALINVWQTQVALDSTFQFDDIDAATIPQLNFSSQRDIPGYRWKNVTVDITGGGTATYEVRTNYNYIFRTQEGNYFKLRFLSYTLDGRSGFPRFEYSGL
jgi:hypothetical protein